SYIRNSIYIIHAIIEITKIVYPAWTHNVNMGFSLRLLTALCFDWF
ncbi:uncharacterized protein METZ01_LOCUS322568, partial [marine metagenome]